MTETPTVQVNGFAVTNPSILELMRREGSDRPVEEVVRALARAKLAEADTILCQIDAEWSPPPYDPILVAQALGIRCEGVDFPWLEDAMICYKEGIPTILYRRQRSRARTCFNIYHEIAHTLFPDFQKNILYQRSARPRLFEPEGQLEFLCDIAATEFLMPMNLFRSDLEDEGFGAERVGALCARYEASVEAVCLRMVESNVEECTLALVEHRQDRPRREKNSCEANEMAMRVIYAVPSRGFRERQLYFPQQLSVGSSSPLHRTSRSKKPSQGEEWVELKDRSQQFYVETLALTSRPRRHGRTPVLAFFYPR